MAVLWVCTPGMPGISLFRVAAALNVHRGFPELKKRLLRRVQFGWGGILCFLFSFFILRTHTTCCKYESALPHLLLY